MPNSVGPNAQAEDSLVLAFDTRDTKNSYIGEPTTNIATGLGFVPVALDPITYIGMEDGWKKYSLGGTWNSGTYPYAFALTPVTFTGGLPYCSRATIKTNVHSKFNYFGANGISYVNEPKNSEGTLSSTLNLDGSYTVTRYNFAYTNTTNQAGYIFANPVSGITFDPTRDFVWVKEYQVEQKTHPTQYVDGSRSVTQSLLSLAGSSTINLSNVSFDNNAQIVFDGSDDYLSISSGFYPTTSCSVEFVFNHTHNLVGSKYLMYGAGGLGFTIFMRGDWAGDLLYFLRRVNNSGNYGDSAWGYTTGIYVSAPSNQNTHFIFTHDSGTGQFRCYKNGTLVRTIDGNFKDSGGLNTTQVTHYLGGTPGDNFPMNLPIFKVYNRVLQDSEVQENYKAVKGQYNI